MDNIQGEGEVDRLRKALDAETRRCLYLQRRLGLANAEFEQFVSMAAHNLREPLRDVASYSQLIAETCAGTLDSDANLFLARIREGAARMQSLLADVVEFWATDAGVRRASPVDMEAALTQALLSTDQQSKREGALVTHDPLPAVTGDFETLTKVLHHLIRNAIEYRGTAPPCVHISARREGADWLLSVQDNGPGIEPEFQQRIFNVFKRLHGGEFPGNGLGLAFCRKAVEGHGGRMWVNSAPGAGSTFCFTLPPAE